MARSRKAYMGLFIIPSEGLVAAVAHSNRHSAKLKC
jgi:hypothetical protein